MFKLDQAYKRENNLLKYPGMHKVMRKNLILEVSLSIYMYVSERI